MFYLLVVEAYKLVLREMSDYIKILNAERTIFWDYLKEASGFLSTSESLPLVDHLLCSGVLD
jgi:hypothetical protein